MCDSAIWKFKSANCLEFVAKVLSLCFKMAVAILPSTAIYPQRLFCHELFVIGDLNDVLNM